VLCLFLLVYYVASITTSSSDYLFCCWFIVLLVSLYFCWLVHYIASHVVVDSLHC